MQAKRTRSPMPMTENRVVVTARRRRIQICFGAVSSWCVGPATKEIRSATAAAVAKAKRVSRVSTRDASIVPATALTATTARELNNGDTDRAAARAA